MKNPRFSIWTTAVTLPRLSDLQCFAWMRALCGLHLLVYQFSIQLPNYINFYSKQGMVNPDLFEFYKSSPLFIVWEMETLKFLLFVGMIALSVAFTLGFYARAVHVPLFLLSLSFQLANPMVIHEPQQLLQLLLVLMWFVPYETHLTMNRTPGFHSYENIEEKYGQKIVWTLLGFLSFYYLMAGVKKLPDPMWIQGDALSVLVQSPHLGKQNFFAQLFANNILSALATWFTIAFEIGFVFLAFTRLRPTLFVIGIFFHIANIFVFEVGLFWMAMWMWYPLLLFKRGARKPLAL